MLNRKLQSDLMTLAKIIAGNLPENVRMAMKGLDTGYLIETTGAGLTTSEILNEIKHVLDKHRLAGGPVITYDNIINMPDEHLTKLIADLTLVSHPLLEAATAATPRELQTAVDEVSTQHEAMTCLIIHAD